VILTHALSLLERALARDGSDLMLRRRVGTSAAFVTHPVRGFARGYAPKELTGGIIQGDSVVVVSPLAFEESWQGAAGGPILPRKGDQIQIDGVWRNVEAAHAVRLGDGVARIELQVRG
jgi:hypothetical protein